MMNWQTLSDTELMLLSDAQLAAVPPGEWRRRLSHESPAPLPEADVADRLRQLQLMDERNASLEYQMRRLLKGARGMHRALDVAAELLPTGRAGEANQILELAQQELHCDAWLMNLLAGGIKRGEQAA